MKYLMFIGFLFCSTFIYSQDTYKRTYYIPKTKLKLLKTEKKVNFSYFSPKQQDSIRKTFNGFETVEYVTTKIINGKSVEVKKTEAINEEFFKNQKYTITVNPNRKEVVKAFVKFPDDKNKILINPFISKSDTINSTYFITLKNRHKEWLPFTEFTVSSVTIPLKYRFKDKSNDIAEEFTSAINLNFLLGYSYGNSSFMFRDKVGNKSNTWKLTGGIILGASTVELNNSNTSSAVIPLESGNTINQGLFSFGFGATYSFNKLNFGVFYGWDYSLGDASEKWNYNKLPWLGIGVGYSLFKI
tara:strand:- start:547 stop:1446 length:900 start_codon:yes stop_codon:yes gene_type:complete